MPKAGGTPLYASTLTLPGGLYDYVESFDDNGRPAYVYRISYYEGTAKAKANETYLALKKTLKAAMQLAGAELCKTSPNGTCGWPALSFRPIKAGCSTLCCSTSAT